VIREVQGDILLSNAAVIAHGVAPNDDFKRGLALALRERWPAMYKDFQHHAKTHPGCGQIWTWGGANTNGGATRIANLFTQEPSPAHGTPPGRAKIEHVNHALKALASYLASEKASSVALPKLGTGVGALEWQEVRPLIEKHLGSLSIPVILYTTYKKGVAADEKLAVARTQA
jgi:O-acetyl-ADP-ribose deacetylase (regulator of RNase III)